jgi:hypothetical protein
MVGATPTPGHGCSGRLWVTRCARDYLRGAATRRRFFTTRHVTSFQSADMSAHPGAWTTRVAQKRKPEAYATFGSRSRKQKTVGEAVRPVVGTLIASLQKEGQPLYGHSFAFLFFSLSAFS